jgi:serologically defined colon cancer antigen 8
MTESGTSWNYNVSKKIVQLTRLVFRLHTESVDRADLVAHIRRKCDDEISSIVQHSSAALEEVQQGAADYRDSLERILRDEYSSKLQLQVKECQILKERLDSEVKQFIDRSIIQIGSLRKEVESLKSCADCSRQHFEEQAAELSRQNQLALSAMERRHKQEMEHCVQKANDRYNEMVTASEQREEALRNQMQSEMAELRRSTMASSLVHAKNLKQRVAELEVRNHSLEIDVRKAGFTIAKLKGDVARLENENTLAKDQAKTDKEELNKIRCQENADLVATFDTQMKEKVDKIDHLHQRTLTSPCQAIAKEFEGVEQPAHNHRRGRSLRPD